MMMNKWISAALVVILMAAGVAGEAAAAAVAEAQGVPLLLDVPMNGAAGKLADQGPLGLQGTYEGAASLAADRGGSVLVFSGKQEPVKIDSHWTIDNLVKSGTITLWIKPAARPGGDISFIISKRPGWWTGTPWAMGLDRDGRISAMANDGSDHWIHSDAAMELKSWHQIGISYEAGKRFTMYIDGQKQKEDSGIGRLRGSTEPLHLGYVKGGDFPGGNYQAYQGAMDEVRIYAACLTDEQMKAQYAGKLETRAATKADYPVRGMDLSAIPAEAKRASDGELICQINFDAHSPEAQGMWYDSPGSRIGEITVDGKTSRGLVAGTAMGMPWARSVQFLLTDERFKNGKMPAVDIEVVYLNKAWAPVTVLIDSQSGSREAGSGWQAEKWNTIRCSVDDAFFGNRDFGHADNEIKSDGYDLRINGFNSDLCIRSIKIIGHKRQGDVDWGRMLKLTHRSGDGALLVYPPKSGRSLSYHMSNMALEEAGLTWSWKLEDLGGKVAAKREGKLTLGGEQTGEARIEFDASKLPLGPYITRFEAHLAKASAKPLGHDGKIGIISEEVLEKAKAGEFLYGLCPQATGLELTEAWSKVMGVDILRGAGVGLQDDGLVDRLLGQGVGVMVMCDPPKEGAPGTSNEGMDPAKRAGELKKLTGQLSAFAKRNAGKVVYYELGNEPDLRFFYPGPIEEYFDSFKTMRRAIKGADGGAVVMNGGLCFAGAEGDQRARKMIGLIKPGDLDALAYHGHGAGVKAERDAYNRSREVALKNGLKDLVYVETESGMAADGNNPGELMLQARTCVQKIIFAQSVGSPTFFWFAQLIEGGDGNYTTTEENGIAPRPAALAYRNMVKQLRHQRFVRMVDLQVPDTEGYVFEDAGTHGRVLVAWCNRPALQDVALRLDQGQVNDAQVSDLFGNRIEGRRLPGGLLAVAVGVEPIYVSWMGQGSLDQIRAEASMIQVKVDNPVMSGWENQASVSVRNEGKEAATFTLENSVYSMLEANVAPAKTRVKVEGGGTVQVPLAIKLGAAKGPLGLPDWWRVFAKVDAQKVDLGQVRTMAVELPGVAGMTRGVQTLARDGGIQLGKIGGVSKEKDAAVAMATLYCAQPTRMKVGASADWWMAWYVNGEKVFDTLESGNNGAVDHLKYQFELPLKAGENLISVMVLSGSQGWSLKFGGEAELLRQNSNGADANRLVCRVWAGDTLLSEQAAPLVLAEPLGPSAGLLELGDWQKQLMRQPAAVLDSLSVTNYFDKFPQAQRWYQGEADLSALAWVDNLADQVAVTVAVRDSAHVDPAAGKLELGDSVQIALSDQAGKELVSAWAGYADGKAIWQGELPAGVTVDAAKTEQGVAYRLMAPKSLLGDGALKLQVKVMDNDEGYLKQTAKEAGVKIGLGRNGR